ncbi:hypothetical protein [Streptomyces sp. AC495_CC817]|uniref:hypothetical protein n=1 Tax=Streptomyces sp. AC495_CC817 TaxID=2823900 RepID=UPI001C27CE2F|nr:hypothetical protein [Streptomyces sp. AC495_CC817]
MDCVLAESGSEPSLVLVIVGVVALALGVAVVMRRRAPRAVRGALVLSAVLVGAAALTGLSPQAAVAEVSCDPTGTSDAPVTAATPAPDAPITTPTAPVIDGEVTATLDYAFDAPSGLSSIEYGGSFGPSAASTGALPAGATVEFTLVNHVFGGGVGTATWTVDPRLACTPSPLPTSLNTGGVFEETVVVTCRTTAPLNPGDAPAAISVAVNPSYSGAITATIVDLPGDIDGTNDTRREELAGA